MLLSIIKFFRGFVCVRLSGYAPERFFNLCSKRNILIWNLERNGEDYEFCISVQAFMELRPILRKTKMVLMVMAVVMCMMTNTVLAAGDPLSTINSLSDFIFSAIKAIGLILLGFGIVQIGLSLKSHDASQRANVFLRFFSGVIIAFAKDILDMIM